MIWVMISILVFVMGILFLLCYNFDSELGIYMVLAGIGSGIITSSIQASRIIYPNPVEYREILSVTKTNHTAIVTFENPATKTYMTETFDTASIVNATNIYVRVFSGLNGFKRKIMPKHDIINGDSLILTNADKIK